MELQVMLTLMMVKLQQEVVAVVRMGALVVKDRHLVQTHQEETVLMAA